MRRKTKIKSSRGMFDNSYKCTEVREKKHKECVAFYGVTQSLRTALWTFVDFCKKKLFQTIWNGENIRPKV